VAFDTAAADVRIGDSYVRQRNGTYHLRGEARGASGPVLFDFSLTPAPNRYFPPVELREEDFASGYVVPGLVAGASGRICLASSCRRITDAPAYHDHNWGVWRDVSWEWGSARGSRLSLLYGGIYGPRRGPDKSSAVNSPFFLALVDSVGVKQVLRFDRIDYRGSRLTSGTVRVGAPERFSLIATRETDTLHLDVRVSDALATPMATGAFRKVFLQMRGHFTLMGRVLGRTVADSGTGFFETYLR